MLKEHGIKNTMCSFETEFHLLHLLHINIPKMLCAKFPFAWDILIFLSLNLKNLKNSYIENVTEYIHMVYNKILIEFLNLTFC